VEAEAVEAEVLRLEAEVDAFKILPLPHPCSFWFAVVFLM
jgi:hypothetical protein